MKFKKYQAGGTAPDPSQQQSAPAQDPNAAGGQPQDGGQDNGQGGGGDPLMQIAQAMAQALQTNDCEGLKQAATAFLQLIQQAAQQQGGAEQQQGQPVYQKKGGKMVMIKRQ